MLNNHNELFLSEYFFCRCVLGKVVKDKYAMFDTLAEVFLVDPAQHDALFALAENETVADVKTHGDQLRFCRIKNYASLNGEQTAVWADIDDVILNTLGAVIGYVAYRIINRCIKKREKMLTLMAVLLSVGLIAGVIVLYLAGYLIDGFPNIIF